MASWYVPSRHDVGYCLEADRVKFDDSFTKQGLEGGKLAARALRTAVAQLCSHERTGSLEIICRVVANVGGLSKALASEGCIENPNLFRDFTQGFTQARASFDFLDVGFGKERADAKIRGMVFASMLKATPG